jgi:hypothetical protein
MTPPQSASTNAVDFLSHKKQHLLNKDLKIDFKANSRNDRMKRSVIMKLSNKTLVPNVVRAAPANTNFPL